MPVKVKELNPKNLGREITIIPNPPHSYILDPVEFEIKVSNPKIKNTNQQKQLLGREKKTGKRISFGEGTLVK